MDDEITGEHLIIVKELARVALTSCHRAAFLDELDLSDDEADRVLVELNADLQGVDSARKPAAH